jgi:hypothetical protein
VRELSAARAGRRTVQDDDIRDPIGLPIEVQEEVGEAIAGALLPVLRRLTQVVGNLSAERPAATGR